VELEVAAWGPTDDLVVERAVEEERTGIVDVVEGNGDGVLTGEDGLPGNGREFDATGVEESVGVSSVRVVELVLNVVTVEDTTGDTMEAEGEEVPLRAEALEVMTGVDDEVVAGFGLEFNEPRVAIPANEELVDVLDRGVNEPVGATTTDVVLDVTVDDERGDTTEVESDEVPLRAEVLELVSEVDDELVAGFGFEVNGLRVVVTAKEELVDGLGLEGDEPTGATTTDVVLDETLAEVRGETFGGCEVTATVNEELVDALVLGDGVPSGATTTEVVLDEILEEVVDETVGGCEATIIVEEELTDVLTLGDDEPSGTATTDVVVNAILVGPFGEIFDDCEVTVPGEVNKELVDVLALEVDEPSGATTTEVVLDELLAEPLGEMFDDCVVRVPRRVKEDVEETIEDELCLEVGEELPGAVKGDVAKVVGDEACLKVVVELTCKVEVDVADAGVEELVWRDGCVTDGTVNAADLLVSLELLTEVANGDAMGATVVVVV
jgi:hypothetical protein